MFTYRVAQKSFEIGGIKVGGESFENPPVLIASIFYHGHKIVFDPKKGEFDKVKAEELIKIVEELSAKTRIPFMLDVVGTTPEAITRFIDFVANVTKAPILIDTVGSLEAAKAALEYVKGAGLANKVVYNSLTAKSKDEEYKLLQEYGVKAAIALLYTDRIVDVEARLQALNTILQKASTYGIDKILVDTFIIDVPSLSAACRAMVEVKARYGLPVGAGAHNAISTQRKSFKERFGAEGLKASELAANVMPIVLGTDFLLYGPIEATKEIFPAVYTIYTAYRYLARRKENLIQL
jgi:tetrahydromethanopterin S-methyltransferase subunit H